METVTKCFSLILATCFILLHHGTSAQELQGKALIEKICADTSDKIDCITVLTSNPKSEHASLPELAMMSLKMAAADAAGILNDAKMMIDNPDLDPGIQQGLADCKETLLDAESQLEDTIASLLSSLTAKKDAQVWLRAALAAIDTCDASIPGDDDVLSKKSVHFRKLCNIAVAISKVLPTDPEF